MIHPTSNYAFSVVFVTAISLLPAARIHAETRQTRPNIVMILSDDQTYTDFGFMGNERVHTPHLDQLARASARFTHGYVPASVCRPSLVTLLTGLYPHQHGVHFNHPPPGFATLLKSEEIGKAQFDAFRSAGAALIRTRPSLPRLLAESGYQCLQTGKFWEGHYRNAGFTHGMTTAQPSGGPNGDITLANGDVVAHGNGDHGLAIGRETMQPIEDFLDETQGQPFFVWYAPFLPHTPHDSPQRYRDLYNDRNDIAEHELPYFAAIAQFDDTVGQLVHSIEKRGLTDNTLFVFAVDNGWEPDVDRYIERRGEWDHTKKSKRAPFDAGLRTPILFRWDGHTQARTITRPVSSVEIVPTILTAAGIDIESLGLPADGLLGEAIGEADGDPNEAVFGAIYPGDASVIGDPGRDVAYRWVRKQQYKLIVPVKRNKKQPWNRYLDEPALYDVVSDPAETDNLIDRDELFKTVTELQGLLDHWWKP
tara:strand:- start:269652 stop:271088 length:1437 start_codon:yes stop_codon:yes gene_type:complete